ncbi:hypothetical protein HMN09_00378500 [Mycena chlorophos]|uniref:Uncharacterized protein n=1 Tax=Mycena chlorophos TaxID=658473 RepID=A0A8H6TJ46_MYCCL|nr:hypothetical protein HMN09_00378500 [Mycena chlorophos]
MLWLPAAPKKTRSGRTFAEFFESRLFSIRPALCAAVRTESDMRGDTEPPDNDEEGPDGVDEAPAGQLLRAAMYGGSYVRRARRQEEAVGADVGQPPRKRRKVEREPIRIEDVPAPTNGSLSRAHRKRQGQRRTKVEVEGHVPRAAAYARRAAEARPLQTGLESGDLPVELGAYRAGMPDAKELRGSKKSRGIDDFLRLGFQVLRWNGIDGVPLVDSEGRVFAVLAGRPKGATYDGHVHRAFCLMVAAAAARAAAKTPVQTHRRGFYTAITVGISYGQGQTEPCSLQSEHPELAEQLVKDSAFQELASFASSMLAFWAPRLYDYYQDYNTKLDPSLKTPRPFARSVFASATFNLGPNVWTFKHRDVLNLPFGWCAITALGNFDHTKGGHLVLWDLKLVIEFPAGATILIPSATLAHSNIPVSKYEHRSSFTQYTAGGLFRYIDNGFRTEGELAEEDPELYEVRVEEKEKRYQEGLALWSTMDELVARAE